MKRLRLKFICQAVILFFAGNICDAGNPIAYDMEMAKEICLNSALDHLEGIWIYPDDHVTVLILKKDSQGKVSSLPEYDIRVIDGEDARLAPGVSIGTLYATPNANVFKIELMTEEKNKILCKPYSCLANLSKDHDNLIIKKTKSPFRLRLNLNFNRLLTGFWKIVSVGTNKNYQNLEAPAGMVKIFPSYDGNGSSKRKPRYL